MSDTLFDLDRSMFTKPAPKTVANVDWGALEQLAFCYTATYSGNNSGIRFMLTIEEARDWCSSDISRGTLHGTRWVYCYTSVANFARHHKGDADAYPDAEREGRPVIVTKGLTDNGQWDDRIASLGLTKIAIHEFAEHLTRLGVVVIA